MYTKRFFPHAWCAAALAAVLGATAGTAQADPPERVARIGFLRGEVSFQPAGDDRWVEASLNRPLVTGDKVYTDRDSRAEFEIGAAVARVDERTTFNLLNLDDNFAQIELTEGVMNLRVRRLDNGESYEIDTPTLAFVVNQPGSYRIDIAPQGDSTMITVFEGGGDVYGENNASYSVRDRTSYRFSDSTLRDYEQLDLPRADDFDNWVASRETRYTRSVSRRYVADDMIGYADLDDHGSWYDDREYGSIWYPTSISTGWAPYRYGHWSWVDPWGWTWIDNASWGFAPFHYGRWVYARNRWGWCPGPRHVRAVYAPALVGFVGGGGWGVSISAGGPVGWFPLGPRDVYVPWYRASRGYFNTINVRNTTVINNVHITNIYNDYSAGRVIRNANYAYRGNINAVTAVSRETFVNSRNVGEGRVRVDQAQLRNAAVASRVAIAPTQASFVAANSRMRQVTPAAAMDRRVIARTAPPAPPVSTAARVRAIERNDAQPLARTQLREMPATDRVGGTATRQRVQVVGSPSARPQTLPSRTPGERATPRDARTTPVDAPRGDVRTPVNSPRGDARSPVNSPRGEVRSPTSSPREDARGRSDALPSSRFAPRGDRGPATQRSTPEASRDRSVSPRETNPSRDVRQMPQRESRESPQVRQMPQRESREAPQVRQMPQRELRESPQVRQMPQRESREAPQVRQMPQRESRESPQVRQMPQRESREAPQVRQMPQRESREAPQVRQMPQRETREAPQMRQMPQRESREAPQVRQPAQQREAPRQRNNDNRDKSRGDDDDRRH